MGDADVYDITIKTIANHSKAAVAFVNYPRSPEFKYPIALNHVYETVKFFSENGTNYGINPQKIAIVLASPRFKITGFLHLPTACKSLKF